MCIICKKVLNALKGCIQPKPILLISFMMIPLVSMVAEKVVTIYFCGTGVTHEWVDADQSGFHSPELLSLLYQNDMSAAIDLSEDQLSATSDYYKLIIDGIATPALEPPLLHHNFFDPEKWVEGEANRRWDECLDEAQKGLTLIMESEDDAIELNLLGHGRGAVLCMLLSRQIADEQNSRITRINILAFDPVPGYPDVEPILALGEGYGELSLPSVVKQYIGVYAQDERSFRYEPLIPALDEPEETSTWLLSVPGSHETMVGSQMDNGHSLSDGVVNNNYSINEELGKVSDISKLMAVQLLTSPEWGNVPFNEMLANSFVNMEEADFSQLVDNINQNIDYWPMHGLSFGEAFGVYDPDHYTDPNHIGHELLASADTASHQYRLCYVAPYREEDNTSNPDRVFFLSKWTTALVDGSMAWNKLQSLRGDLSAPLPILDELPDIVAQCSVDTVEAPYAYDATDGIIQGVTDDPLQYYEQGNYTITWMFIDNTGNSISQEQQVIVQDTIAPVPGIDPLPVLVGQCEVMDIVAPTAEDNCMGAVTATTEDPLYYSERGEYTIEWNYDDGHGNISTQFQNVIVNDTIAPVITLKYTDPIVLWPVNHKFETFTIDMLVEEVYDNCSELTINDVVITSVTSDEEVNTNGDGSTMYDILIGDDCHSVDLRKERMGGGNGRVYTIYISVSDESDNVTMESIQVIVPHDKKDGAIDDGVAYTVNSNCHDVETGNDGLNGSSNSIMDQNFPNPFKVSTSIPLNIKDAGQVTISIYNAKSQLVKILYSGFLSQGNHKLNWNGTDANNQLVDNGIYFCTLTMGSTEIESLKIVVMR